MDDEQEIMSSPVNDSRTTRGLRRVAATLTPTVRFLVVCAAGLVSVTCADRSTGLRKLTSLAKLAIAPAFQASAVGGPDIEIERIRGVLKRTNGLDSSVAEAMVQGDSAILEFDNVSVNGDSTLYTLRVTAFDTSDVVVFDGADTIGIKPGNNQPAAPQLNYSAPDTAVASILISPRNTTLDWAGAAPGDQTCLNHDSPGHAPKTQQAFTVTGTTASNQAVSKVRVGWTSRDTTVVTVDENGLARSKCANGSSWIVARTFLNKADSVNLTVTAPVFTLLMNPDSVNLRRGDTLSFKAVVVDETGKQLVTSTAAWSSSDPTRATVNSAGLVTAIRNGRVLITASANSRTSQAVVQVIRPLATTVRVVPVKDSLNPGGVMQFVAKAFDAVGSVIAEAAGFTWASSKTSIATVNGSGVVSALNVTGDSSSITASIDGKTGTGILKVLTLPPGTIKGFIKDGASDAPLAGASISVTGGTPVTSAADGSYSLGGVKAGDDISVSKTGYATVTYFNAPAFPNQTIQVPTVPLPPSGGSGTITGKVVNALNLSGVSGVTVKAYAGLNGAPSIKRPDVTPVTTATTNSNGVYTLTAAAGAYTLVAGGTGYSEGITVGVAVPSQTKNAADLLLPPAAPGGGLYAVLTWSSSGTNVPADLDLRLTGPRSSTDTSRFQVNGTTRAYVVSTDTIAALDASQTSGPGPEVISLRPAAPPGGYRFYVHNVSGAATPTSRALADSSGARVDVFQDNRVIATFFPPNGAQGTLWEVFKYDGARIFPVGTITQASNPPVVNLRAAPAPARPKPTLSP